MSFEKVEVTLTLIARSRLMIGNGLVEAGEQNQKETRAQLIALDGNGSPWIPASTLKGCLRAMHVGTDTIRLFGEIRSDGTGRMGDVSFGNAWLLKGSPIVLVDTSRVAIDRHRGAAEHNKLFRQLAVPAGAKFEARFVIGADSTDDLASAARRLGGVLAPLFSGVRIGTGRRQGCGMVLADQNQVRIRCLRLVGGRPKWSDSPAIFDAFRASIKAGDTRQAPIVDVIADLSIDGDYSRLGKPRSSFEPGRSHTTTTLERDDLGAPLLTGTTVIGALRARCAWLAELDWLRGGAEAGPVGRDRATDTVDQRFTPLDEFAREGDGGHTIAAVLPMLSSVERLFGISGWAGLVEIAELSSTNHGHKHDRTSTAIDRFTGGSLHGALYKTEVAQEPIWRLRLVVRPTDERLSAWSNDMRHADLALLARLIADVRAKGLDLGHGTGKGWGWAKLQVSKQEGL